jgi:hypothetical protein
MKVVNEKVKEELVAEVGDIIVSDSNNYFLIVGVIEGGDGFITLDKTFTLVNLGANVVVHSDYNADSVLELVEKFEKQHGKTDLIKSKDAKLSIK